MKNSKGITLIALVITIIVLLILAGVSISMVIGDNGILKQANTAKTKTAEAEEAQQKALDDLKTEMDNWLLGETNGGTTGGTTGGSTASTLSSQITSANYGDTVAYTAPNGLSEWKVFYKNGNNVFLIASDILADNLLPLGITVGSYGDLQYTTSNLNNVNSEVATKYMCNEENITYTRDKFNLDTSNWNSFVDSDYAESAIGTPTSKMWLESWNTKDYTKLIYEVNQWDGSLMFGTSLITPSDHGVWFKMSDANQSNIKYYLDNADGHDDELYFPHTQYVNDRPGYYLTNDNAIDFRGGIFNWGGVKYPTLRPVVCLNENVKATKTNGTWVLEK